MQPRATVALQVRIGWSVFCRSFVVCPSFEFFFEGFNGADQNVYFDAHDYDTPKEVDGVLNVLLCHVVVPIPELHGVPVGGTS